MKPSTSSSIGNSVARSTSPRNYRPDIDGLRAIAVLAVVAFHAYPQALQGGFVGVDIFFVISGYLISNIIFTGLRDGNFSFAGFYSNRVRRIFPALILVLAFCLCAGWFLLLPDEYAQLGNHSAGGAAFIQNFLLYKEVGYFDTAAELKPLLHLWSLSIEEQFYIVYPVLVWALWRTGFGLPAALVGLAALSFILNISWRETKPDLIFYFPSTRAWELLAGGLLAYINFAHRLTLARTALWCLKPFGRFLGKSATDAAQSARVVACNLTAIAGITLLVTAVALIHRKFSFPGFWAAIPVAGTILLILAGPASWINRKILANRAMVFIGLISYPLYLWHWPLLSFARILERDSDVVILGCIALSFVLAALTYRLLEVPVRFGKRRKTDVAVLAALMIATAGAGLYVANQAFPERKLEVTRSDFQELIMRSGSDRWFRGKDDWLFLGNSFNDTLRKLELRATPSAQQISSVTQQFADLAEAAEKSGIPVVLLVGPDKNRVYREHLPDMLRPSQRRHLDFFLNELRAIPNLIIHDPLTAFQAAKGSGHLYWRTDTHWNPRGSLLAWNGLAARLSIPAAPAEARPAEKPHRGDLLKISQLTDFSLHENDNFELVWETRPDLEVDPPRTDEPRPAFSPEVIRNRNPLTDQRVWVIGDSFGGGVIPYINTTFRESHYLGHWAALLPGNAVSKELEQAEHKPDLIIVVRVERSF